MTHIFLSWHNIERLTQDILRQIQNSNWQPDYVVGIVPGGLMPATLISQYLDIPLQTLGTGESNLWMAEDAADGKRILIVDALNDTGETLNWIKQDWESNDTRHDWQSVWGNNVRVAVLHDNLANSAELGVDYCAAEINNFEHRHVITYPWQSWWGMNKFAVDGT